MMLYMCPVAYLVNLCRILYTFRDDSDRQHLLEMKVSSSKPSIHPSYGRVVSPSTVELPSDYTGLCLPQISGDGSKIQLMKNEGKNYFDTKILHHLLVIHKSIPQYLTLPSSFKAQKHKCNLLSQSSKLKERRHKKAFTNSL